VADQPAVRLELRLAGAAHADAAAELLEVRPHARQPRQHVLQLRELHLELGLVRPRARGEDVEDQLGPVHHPDADRLLHVLPLRGAQLVVEQDERRVEVARLVAQLVELALAEVGGRVRAVELLGERAHDVGAGGVRQAGELLEVLLDAVAVGGALEGGAHEHDALGGRGDGDQVACDRDDSFGWSGRRAAGLADAAEAGELAGAVERPSEATDRGADRHVSEDAVVDGARAQQLPAHRAEAGEAELNGDPHTAESPL
jgi:hypothetical protein